MRNFLEQPLFRGLAAGYFGLNTERTDEKILLSKCTSPKISGKFNIWLCRILRKIAICTTKQKTKKKKKQKKNVGQFVKKGYARKELLNTIKEIYRGRKIGRKGVFRILLNL